MVRSAVPELDELIRKGTRGAKSVLNYLVAHIVLDHIHSSATRAAESVRQTTFDIHGRSGTTSTPSRRVSPVPPRRCHPKNIFASFDDINGYFKGWHDQPGKLEFCGSVCSATSSEWMWTSTDYESRAVSVAPA